MDIQRLFTVQQELNDRITEEHRLQNQNLLQEKQLAFLVELGELANETRCFKYWSLKPASERSVILEEYVDGLHFVLTLGLTLGFTDITIKENYEFKETMTDQFLTIMQHVHLLNVSHSEHDYFQLVDAFFALGQQLGFSKQEIEASYLKKNKINHQRQDNGY